MPLTEVKPQNLEALKMDVKTAPKGQEDLLIRNIMRQFGRKAYGIYRHTIEDEIKDVAVTNEDSCMVYVITGRITVGEEDIIQDKVGEAEVAYLIQNGKTIKLHRVTAIVVFH
ncbi:hypothetical protein V501_00507 [Pseudogymnoascus sp. VKM F-4519 (FW-2642)]|nr:hypothetical protein V501_00507 [Pseudogymnoascus sp. VKM F-4519 (FW-2642)]